MSSFHVPLHMFKTIPLHRSVTFGGQVQKNVKVIRIRLVTIRFVQPNFSFFDYEYLFIPNVIPILLGIKTQVNLHEISGKHST